MKPSPSTWPPVARLESPHSLMGPERANYVRVLWPSGLAVAGAILQGERRADGSGWLTFTVEHADLGVAG